MNKKKSKVYRCADCNYIFSAVSDSYDNIRTLCPRCDVHGIKRCIEHRALEAEAQRRLHQPLFKTRVYTFKDYDGLMRARFETEENLATFKRHRHHIFDTNPVVPGEVWLTPCLTQANTWDVAAESPTNAGKQLRSFVTYCEQNTLQSACYGHYLEMTDDMRALTSPQKGPEQKMLSGVHLANGTNVSCDHTVSDKNGNKTASKRCHG